MDFFDDDFDFGWDDLAALGALSEELSEEEKERLRLERELEIEEEPCCCTKDDEESDPSGEDFLP